MGREKRGEWRGDVGREKEEGGRVKRRCEEGEGKGGE